jgi:hypothetical protein
MSECTVRRPHQLEARQKGDLAANVRNRDRSVLERLAQRLERVARELLAGELEEPLRGHHPAA